MDADEGARFIAALEPTIAVLPARLLADPEDAARIGEATAGPLAVVAIGAASQEPQMPRWALFVAEDGLTPDLLLNRLRSVILGQEVGVDTDVEGVGLVGELAHHPIFELLPRLADAGVTGTLSFSSGELHFGAGEILAATCPPVVGKKAFCRLARRDRGLFRFQTTEEASPRQFQESLEELLVLAFEDALGETPDPNADVRLDIGPTFFETQFSPLQRRILAAVRKEATVQALLDQCVDQLDGEVLHEIVLLEHQGHVRISAARMPVTVVTDSTADLPSGAARSLGIHVVPLTVTFGDQGYQDGLELPPRKFYDLLERREHHPFTTPPSEETFTELYRSLVERQNVVSVHISERIPSLTVVHAREAAEKVMTSTNPRPSSLPPCVEVLDSQQTSVPLGMLAIFAARMAARGFSAPEIRQRMDEISPRIRTFFIVDTLEFLARGGRIGKAQAWIGRLLNIKPILGLEEGCIVPVERVRGGRRAQHRLLEIFGETFDPELPILLGVGHSQAPAWADRLARSLAKKFPVLETLSSEMGPVIGTHVGPGTVGAAAFQPRGEELDLVGPLDSRGP